MQMSQDYVRRFMFKQAPLRGQIVRLQQSFTEALRRFAYPLPLQGWLGQALAAATLLSNALKYEGSLILQLQGDGVVSLLLAQANAQRHIRGLAKWEGEIPDNFAEAFGRGQLGIIIDPGKGSQRYQGVVPIIGLQLATVIENYFNHSEQLPTVLMLGTTTDQAIGVLLQLMPEQAGGSRAIWASYQEAIRNHLSIGQLLDATDEAVMAQVFPEQEIEWFKPEAVEFVCHCSREKMAKAIITLGQEEAMAMVKAQQQLIVTCEFCNNQLSFDAVDVENIFRQLPIAGEDKTH